LVLQTKTMRKLLSLLLLFVLLQAQAQTTTTDSAALAGKAKEKAAQDSLSKSFFPMPNTRCLKPANSPA
jgi:hypothetical protein